MYIVIKKDVRFGKKDVRFGKGALAAVENKVEYKIRCNNCMRLFQNEMELGEVEDEDYRSFYFVCPNCQTDAYLIDLT